MTFQAFEDAYVEVRNECLLGCVERRSVYNGDRVIIETISQDSVLVAIQDRMIKVNIEDDDVAGIVSTVDSLDMQEGLSSEKFLVYLCSRGLGVQWCSCRTSRQRFRDLFSEEFAFDENNWNQFQYLSVNSMDDDIYHRLTALRVSKLTLPR